MQDNHPLGACCGGSQTALSKPGRVRGRHAGAGMGKANMEGQALSRRCAWEPAGKGPGPSRRAFVAVAVVLWSLRVANPGPMLLSSRINRTARPWSTNSRAPARC